MKTTIEEQNRRLIQDIKNGHEPSVTCPQCESSKPIKMDYWGQCWHCSNNTCNFITDEIFSVDEINELLKLKERIVAIKKWRI